MPRAARLAKQRVGSEALLLRRVPVAEADLVVLLFTEQLGAVSALARGARRSSKRLSSLEPMHLLRVGLDVAPGRELATLAEAALLRARVGLISRLDAMQAAGRALSWLRRAAPPRTPEPELWDEINALLDALDAGVHDPEQLLGVAGLRMLRAAGWGLELERCVRCGRSAPENARVVIDVRAGGIVCRACGGMGPALGSAGRRRLLEALGGERDVLSGDDAVRAVDLVDRAFAAHGKGEAT